jgi:transposase
MYDHFIAVDWAQANMAIARMTGISDKITTHEGPTDLFGLQSYLKTLKGAKILTLEESTGAQWLYTELKPLVDKILICDPYRNHLLSEGAKTDKIDASKLVQLLRANLLKEVFHSGDELIHIRKIMSAYADLVVAGVRLKNQRSALFRSAGKSHKEDTSLELGSEQFVLEGVDRSIESYEEEKLRYEAEFGRLAKKHKPIRLVKSLPGIGPINAVKIIAYVVDPKRFKTKGQFLSYCGLVKLDRVSGGKSYGKKNSRFCRPLKEVFKTAVSTAIQEDRNNPMRDYYLYLINENKYAEHDARSAVARRIAILTLGVLKSGKNFDPHRRDRCKKSET